MAVDIVDFDLHAELADLVSFLRPQAERKGLRLLVHLDPAAPFLLRGGRQHLRQILINLVANAVKFTEKGHVALRVGCPAQGGKARVLRFEIADTGAGIPPEAQKSIFQSFTQADGATNRRFGGTGLGLAIVRELAQLMGGEVGLESKPQQGSRFWVILPFETRAGTVADAIAESAAETASPSSSPCSPATPPLPMPCGRCWPRAARPWSRPRGWASCAARSRRGAMAAIAIIPCCSTPALCPSAGGLPRGAEAPAARCGIRPGAAAGIRPRPRRRGSWSAISSPSSIFPSRRRR